MTRPYAARLVALVSVVVCLMTAGSARAGKALEAISASVTSVPGQELLLLEFVRPSSRSSISATAVVSVRDSAEREVLSSESAVTFGAGEESAEPVIRLQNPGDGADQRCLTRTIGADDRDDRPLLDRELDAVERLGVAIEHIETLDREHQRASAPR